MTRMNIICVQLQMYIYIHIYFFPQLAHTVRVCNVHAVSVCALRSLCAISIRLLEIPIANTSEIKSRERERIHRCEMETIENKMEKIPFDCILVAFQPDYISTWMHRHTQRRRKQQSRRSYEERVCAVCCVVMCAHLTMHRNFLLEILLWHCVVCVIAFNITARMLQMIHWYAFR